MGRGRTNTFKKAIRHLKSTQIDEKLQMLSEIPTNNTSGIYVVEPERTEIVGQNVNAPLNLTQDDPAEFGRDTSGLFAEDGSILTIEPPGDTSYILGPMISMWYAWGNFTTIGYVRQSDRRMVNLGSISGRIGSWNGNSLNSYGQLTIEQARWYRDQYLNGNTQQYRAFYPGPPSNPADQFGRYLGDMIDAAKELAREILDRIPPITGPWDPNLVPGSAKDKDKKKKDAEPFDMEKYLDSLPPGVKDDLRSGAVPYDPFIDALIASLLKGGKIIQTAGELGRIANNWFNKGRNQRIPDERNASWSDVAKDDWTQRGRTADPRTNPNAPWDPTRGLRPGVPADKGGFGSGPTPLGRRVGELAPKPTFTAGSATSNANDKKNNKKQNQKNSYELSGNLLSESTKSILKNIKKPYVLPEEPKIKLKHKPKIRSVGEDMMKTPDIPKEFKPEPNIWRKHDYTRNERSSQEKKNEILDHLGAADHAWEWMTETSRDKSNKIMYGNFDGQNKKEYKIVRKEELKGDILLFLVDENGKKESILQSDLSCKIADEYDKELFSQYIGEQETAQVDKDPLFKKVSKRLKKEIDYSDKPSKKGYPNDPPPKMVNGWHPKFGDRSDYYNKLDPQSANFMPPTENPEIDVKIERSKNKSK